MTGVRNEPRYVPVRGAFSLKIGKHTFAVEDICGGGARLEYRDQPLPQRSKCQLQGPNIKLDLSIALRDDTRYVVQFDGKSHAQLQRQLPVWAQNQLLSDGQKKMLQSRRLSDASIESLCDTLAACDGLPPNAEEIVKEWISLNQWHIAKLGPDAWDLVHNTLEETFSEYYLGDTLFKQHLGDALSAIRNEGFDTIHAVPMRMLRGLSKFLSQHADLFKDLGIEWKPSLWDFLTKLRKSDRAGGPAQRSCLVAVDTFLSEGVTRRQFLKLIRTISPETLARHYSHLRLVAVVGHDEQQPWEGEAQPLAESAHIDVRPVIGLRLTGNKGRSGKWQSFLRRIGRDPVTERDPSLVVFFYGAPTESIPLYWQRSDDWHPLFRPFEYYNPSHRPIPRAPFFSAFPKTLESLFTRVTEGGAALLYGRQGCGKTYLTARLAEICRASCYIFWYQCRPFDAVENIIEHLDVFLKMFDIEGLSSSLYNPANEAEIAQRLVSSLRKLDQQTVLIFDSMENLNNAEGPADELVSIPFVAFVKHLISALNQKGDSPVSEPFVLLTHTEAAFNDHAIKERANTLGLDPGTQTVLCPEDSQDAFTQSWPLARKLIRNFHALERYAEDVQHISCNDPYRTWLLCYWINRCLRHGKGELTDEVKSRIKEVIDLRQATALSNLNTLHQVIFEKLSAPEAEVLKTAAAWTLPWSIEDLDATLESGEDAKPSRVAETTQIVVQELLHDRAPFLVRLGHSVHDDLRQPFALPVGSEIRPLERFEMPSIAVTFFRQHFDKDPKRPQTYLRMADRLQQRRQEIRGSHPGDDIGNNVLRKTLNVERILCFCSADKPSKAAKEFTNTEEYRELRRLNSWERILQLGRAILRAADRAQDPEFSSEIRCETSVVHANALTEAFRFGEARQECARALESVDRNTYWGCRLRLVLAKCLRYENKYEEALRSQAEVYNQLLALREQSPPGAEREKAAAWIGRTLTASAQCLMSLGRLSEAQAALARIQQLLPEMDEADRRTVNGLRLRHEGTIELLYGNVDEARKLFEQLAAQSSRAKNERVQTIALYKQARTLLEKVRTYEAPLQWQLQGGGNMRDLVSRGVPDRSSVRDWLDQAKEYIANARQGLATLAQGDRKWFPAVDLWYADAQLLELRFDAPGSPGDGQPAVARIKQLVEHVQGRLPPAEAETPEARTLEIQILSDSADYQLQIAKAGGNLVQKVLAGPFMNRRGSQDIDQWSAKVSNPYKHSRRHYEGMYYLWRAIDGSSPMSTANQQAMLEAAAHAYRTGTTLLYAHGMLQSAHPLHRLALACFADHSLGLQELLEATICLFPDVAETVDMVLQRIAEESVESVRQPTDVFYTIPTKVICRLLGDLELYSKIVTTHDQPGESPRVVHCPELVMLAKKLALHCYRWATIKNAKNSDYWAEIARRQNLVTTAQAQLFRNWSEGRVGKLTNWLAEFLTATPSTGRREAESKRSAQAGGWV